MLIRQLQFHNNDIAVRAKARIYATHIKAIKGELHWMLLDILYNIK